MRWANKLYQAIQTHGIEMLGLIVLIAGLIQVGAGAARLAQWFRAVSPAVIKGMLTGIGVLIFASQFHVMVDDKPKENGIQNLITIPQAIAKAVVPESPLPHRAAAAIGALTIGTILLWMRLVPAAIRAASSPSGSDSITESALRPMEPVEPRMVTFLGDRKSVV